MTIIYAIIGIPLTLFTITNLGGFMATAFRYIYRNVCCVLCCINCRRRQLPTNQEDDVETGTGNKIPEGADDGQEVTTVTCSWSTVRQILTNTDDIRSVQASVILSFQNTGNF